ncbi:Periaxin [Durusdinium trenchii]|uniref:Periaxin n=1 Tax=Durusdinium trenchii TaxID=1381693 RepID=A0ABP0PIN0_9DINO
MTRPSGRRALSELLLLVVLACAWHFQDSFVAPKIPNLERPERQLRITRFADSAAEDSVEISGFSGFVVGLAFLPHTCYALFTAFNVVRGESFQFGPYGLELLSCLVSIGLVLWSLGSFLQRGRGLPAGPLGLLGLSEGISYLAALGLVLATIASGIRSGPSLQLSLPPAPQISMPSMPQGLTGSVPSLPALKVPDVKIPEFKVPDVKVPDVKMPKMPDIKVPDVKMPEVKVPAPKAKPPEEKKEEPPAPKVGAQSQEDFSKLFD